MKNKIIIHILASNRDAFVINTQNRFYFLLKYLAKRYDSLDLININKGNLDCEIFSNLQMVVYVSSRFYRIRLYRIDTLSLVLYETCFLELGSSHVVHCYSLVTLSYSSVRLKFMSIGIIWSLKYSIYFTYISNYYHKIDTRKNDMTNSHNDNNAYTHW